MVALLTLECKCHPTTAQYHSCHMHNLLHQCHTNHT